VDADRARLFAIGERHEQIGQFGVGAVRGVLPRTVLACKAQQNKRRALRALCARLFCSAGRLPIVVDEPQPMRRAPRRWVGWQVSQGALD